MAAAPPDTDLQQALALHRLGQLDRAAHLYRRVLSRQPHQLDALQMLGLAEIAQGNAAAALACFERAAQAAPANAGIQFNRGLTLLQLQRTADALAAFDAALQTEPGHAKARQMKAAALQALGRLDEAVAAMEAAAQGSPDGWALLLQQGSWLYQAGRWQDALACFQRAAALQPAAPDPLVNLGTALMRLERPGEALHAFDQALRLQPGAADVHFNRGIALAGLQRVEEAIAAYTEALRLQPGLVEAWVNRGAALSLAQRPAQAAHDFEHALRLRPDHIDALANLAHALVDAGELPRAIAAFGEVLEREPARPYTADALLNAKMRICDWTGFDALRTQVEAQAAESGSVAPTRLFAISDSAALQKKAAQAYAARKHPPALLEPPPAPAAGSRIRIGYFSSDFFAHATAFLMAKVFESHDRTRFHTVAFSFGAPPQDAMHMRLRRAFGEFHDVSGRTDREIVQLARERGIDIAVDLKGLTQHARPGIFAQRAAPVQASYLGYPCTMGAPYIDYLLADATVVPAPLREHYAEKIVSLPHSYQANDDGRPIADTAPTRTEAGLREGAFVFCSFNNPYKITPQVFDVWMRLLQRVEGSLLWLFEGHPLVAANLRAHAQARGVDASRLVFAPHAEHAAHLARHALADLFLDTLPCNAHTTASDALWAGLPLVTCMGEAFAARVAASLLRGVGLPELVTQSLAEYEALACALATDRERLRALRARLAANRRTAPLFDTLRFTRDLERAFTLIHERHAAGLAPDHVDVAAG